jgi:hypothetical protein
VLRTLEQGARKVAEAWGTGKNGSESGAGSDGIELIEEASRESEATAAL